MRIVIFQVESFSRCGVENGGQGNDDLAKPDKRQREELRKMSEARGGAYFVRSGATEGL